MLMVIGCCFRRRRLWLRFTAGDQGLSIVESMIQQWRFRLERVEIVSGVTVEIPFGFAKIAYD
jgi:hypothetical protein